jgi:hypothetical protein
VNYAVDGERVVLRTVAGSKLDAALAGSVVAFEADRFDPSTGEAWSVLVRGSAGVITDPDDLTTLSGLSLQSWGADRGDQWVMISTDLVSGRRTRGRGSDQHGGRRAVASAATRGGIGRGDHGPG